MEVFKIESSPSTWENIIWCLETPFPPSFPGTHLLPGTRGAAVRSGRRQPPCECFGLRGISGGVARKPHADLGLSAASAPSLAPGQAGPGLLFRMLPFQPSLRWCLGGRASPEGPRQAWRLKGPGPLACPLSHAREETHAGHGAHGGLSGAPGIAPGFRWLHITRCS